MHNRVDRKQIRLARIASFLKFKQYVFTTAESGAAKPMTKLAVASSLNEYSFVIQNTTNTNKTNSGAIKTLKIEHNHAPLSFSASIIFDSPKENPITSIASGVDVDCNA